MVFMRILYVFFLCRALGIDPISVWGRFEINHCSITKIDLIQDSGAKIISSNETGHLPENLMTTSEDHL